MVSLASAPASVHEHDAPGVPRLPLRRGQRGAGGRTPAPAARRAPTERDQKTASPARAGPAVPPPPHVGSARIFFWPAILCGSLAILDTVLAALDRVRGGVGRTGQPWPDASVRTWTYDFRPHSPHACRRIEWD
jgi:hypothetical protein